MTQQLIPLGGLGDAYLVASLLDSFCRHYGTTDVELVVKTGHAPVCDLFFPRVYYRINDDLVLGMEADRALQADYLNDLWSGKPFFAHPCMKRTRLGNIDGLPGKPFVCQADIVRLVLGLPLNAQMDVPAPRTGVAVPKRIMIVEAKTWRNTQPEDRKSVV